MGKKLRIKKRTGEPRLYSYIRFSTKKQEEGGSEHRQQRREMKVAKKDYSHLPIDTELRMTDRGLSGFHGDHLSSRGNFGKFLLAIEQDRVASGSVLLADTVNRLGRENPWEAVAFVAKSIVEHGITIHIISPKMILTKKTLRKGTSVFKKFSDKAIEAHEDSLLKSEMIMEAWIDKREDLKEQGLLLTRQLPSWIDKESLKPINDDERPKFRYKDMKPIEGAKKEIRRIFRWAKQGKSIYQIAKELTATAQWKPPARGDKRKAGEFGSWCKSYVAKIVRNPAVIGLYQPRSGRRSEYKPVGKPIENYYPAIVDRGLFFEVQAILDKKKNGASGGRTGKFKNILRHIAQCGYCGHPVVMDGHGKALNGSDYLACDYGNRKEKDKKNNLICSRNGIRYEKIADAILTCQKIDPSEILPNKKNADRILQEANDCLNGLISERDSYLGKAERAVNELLETDDEKSKQQIRNAQAKANKRAKELEPKIREEKERARQVQKTRHDLTNWQADIKSLQEKIKTSSEARQNLNTHLKTFIDYIEIFARGTKEKADEFIDYALEVISDSGNRKPSNMEYEFVSWLRKEALSKNGAFARVHWNIPDRDDYKASSGSWGLKHEGRRVKIKILYKDVLPEGSILQDPNFDKLLRKFKQNLSAERIKKNG